MLLANQRCLLVGATSGIGFEAARRFLAHGARVVLAGIDEAQGNSVRESLASQGEVEFHSCDATDSNQVDALVAQTVRRLGGLDVLYHLVGGSGRRHGDGPLHECTNEGWRYTLDLNLTSTFSTNRAAVRHFLERRQPGVILNMASVLAISPSPEFFDTVAYTAAKGGVLAMTRLLASRYAREGIRVNAIAPGLVDTPMATRAVEDPVVREFLNHKQPLSAGPISAEDLSELAVYLCSGAARLITGQVFPVDGGWCVTEGRPLYTEDNAP